MLCCVVLQDFYTINILFLANYFWKIQDQPLKKFTPGIDMLKPNTIKGL